MRDKRNVRGSPFQVEEPITEKAWRCLGTEGAQGTKSSSQAEERKARQEANSEITKVRWSTAS